MSNHLSKEERKERPLFRGLLCYFPDALMEVAHTSYQGNVQHNGVDSELHWARGKSMDHADCIMRHLIDSGTLDDDGVRHSAKVAWRALALLQQELEDEKVASGVPLEEAISRGSRLPEEAEKKQKAPVYDPISGKVEYV